MQAHVPFVNHFAACQMCTATNPMMVTSHHHELIVRCTPMPDLPPPAAVRRPPSLLDVRWEGSDKTQHY